MHKHVLFIPALFLIAANANAFEFSSLFKSKPPYQDIKDKLKTDGLGVFDRFSGTSKQYNVDSGDSYRPVGYKKYTLSPKGQNATGVDLPLVVETAGNIISLVSMTQRISSVPAFKCDRDGIARFLGIKAEAIEEKHNEILGQTFIGHLYEGDTIHIGVSCQPKAGLFSMNFNERLTEQEFELPGPVCSVKKTCPVPWAPLFMTKKYFLMSKGFNEEEPRSIKAEVEGYLKTKYIPGYLQLLDALSNDKAITKEEQRLIQAWKDTASAPDYPKALIERAIKEIEQAKP